MVRKVASGECAVPVAQLADARGFVGWLAHLAEKKFLSERDLGDFVRAVRDVVGLRELAQK